MFLNRFDSNSKEVFLFLAKYIIEADSSYVEIQEELINKYLQEMNITDIEFEKDEFLLQEYIKKVTNKDHQKIILIELLGIVYNDNVMTSIEKEIIDTIVDIWNINSSLVVVYAEWSKSLLSLYVQGEALLELN
uniref:hypothetical protein n=1 Tax=Aliarcobacter sp. TaxID=2321116 RepID=UPI004048A181